MDLLEIYTYYISHILNRDPGACCSRDIMPVLPVEDLPGLTVEVSAMHSSERVTNHCPRQENILKCVHNVDFIPNSRSIRGYFQKLEINFYLSSPNNTNFSI